MLNSLGSEKWARSEGKEQTKRRLKEMSSTVVSQPNSCMHEGIPSEWKSLRAVVHERAVHHPAEALHPVADHAQNRRTSCNCKITKILALWSTDFR